MSIRPPGPSRIAVTGANGAIGSRVVERLRAQSDADIVPIVRDLSRAHPDERVRPALAPYEDRAALTAALSGCDCLVLIGSDGEADRMLAHHANIIRAARRAEVSRTVLLSSLDADPGSPFCYAHTYATTEGWAREALPGVAVLRAGLYAEFIGHWLWEAARSGVLSLPMGTGRISPVARRDVADLLTELSPRSPGSESADRARRPRVTGPRRPRRGCRSTRLQVRRLRSVRRADVPGPTCPRRRAEPVVGVRVPDPLRVGPGEPLRPPWPPLRDRTAHAPRHSRRERPSDGHTRTAFSR